MYASMWSCCEPIDTDQEEIFAVVEQYPPSPKKKSRHPQCTEIRLHSLLHQGKWDEAAIRCVTHPAEMGIWHSYDFESEFQNQTNPAVVANYPHHRECGELCGYDLKEGALKLPLHVALSTTVLPSSPQDSSEESQLMHGFAQAPTSLVHRLVESCPWSLERRCGDGTLRTPLHMAVVHNAPEATLDLLIRAFPAALEMTDALGRRPLECLHLPTVPAKRTTTVTTFVKEDDDDDDRKGDVVVEDSMMNFRTAIAQFVRDVRQEERNKARWIQAELDRQHAEELVLAVNEARLLQSKDPNPTRLAQEVASAQEELKQQQQQVSYDKEDDDVMQSRMELFGISMSKEDDVNVDATSYDDMEQPPPPPSMTLSQQQPSPRQEVLVTAQTPPLPKQLQREGETTNSGEELLEEPVSLLSSVSADIAFLDEQKQQRRQQQQQSKLEEAEARTLELEDRVQRLEESLGQQSKAHARELEMLYGRLELAEILRNTMKERLTSLTAQLVHLEEFQRRGKGTSSYNESRFEEGATTYFNPEN